MASDASDSPEAPDAPDYLAPYVRAVARYGAGFEALLIADRSWQAARFAALTSLVGVGGRVVADLGSGRADLLAWLLGHGLGCRGYLGVEALAELDGFARDRAREAGWDRRPGLELELIRADFVAEPELCERLVRDHGADVLVFCGSLNTLAEADALAVLDRAWAALERTRGGVLAFNFLAGGDAWPRPATGLPRRDTRAWFAWACERTPLVLFAQHYLGAHDATLVLIRP